MIVTANIHNLYIMSVEITFSEFALYWTFKIPQLWYFML